jgi:hypothetical protein
MSPCSNYPRLTRRISRMSLEGYEEIVSFNKLERSVPPPTPHC